MFLALPPWDNETFLFIDFESSPVATLALMVFPITEKTKKIIYRRNMVLLSWSLYFQKYSYFQKSYFFRYKKRSEFKLQAHWHYNCLSFRKNLTLYLSGKSFFTFIYIIFLFIFFSFIYRSFKSFLSFPYRPRQQIVMFLDRTMYPFKLFGGNAKIIQFRWFFRGIASIL